MFNSTDIILDIARQWKEKEETAVVTPRLGALKVTIDGTTVRVKPGTTILEAASCAGSSIPTLCAHGDDHPCGICVVEIHGQSGLQRACATTVEDGMVVRTQSDPVRAYRKRVLELKLSRHYGDCVSPCSLTCPAGINVQGYLSLIARGEYREALRLIKEKNPLPLTICRVCPRRCESMCRRILVEDRIPINHLKRFVADYALHAQETRFVNPPPTGHHVAVLGGGPAGLSAAYYLARKGHEVTIFESMPELGGMLRYAIPEYRLPKKILDQEIRNILEMGIQVKTGQRLGRDFSLEALAKEGFEAFFLAIGAWKAKKMDVEGEDLAGVYSGLQILRDVRSGRQVKIGAKVAVIGGGNTAIDVARTCLRLGADDVTIVYRRSRLEMPAREQEVQEAVAEGVKLFLAAAPHRITRVNEHLELTLLRTRLGEPDETARRRPILLPGSNVTFAVDSVIAAIGQAPDFSSIAKEIDLGGPGTSRKNPLAVDLRTFATNGKGVFAGGDVASGPKTVIEGIAAGRRAADSIDAYLNGTTKPSAKRQVNVTKGANLLDMSIEDFERISSEPAERIPERPAKIRVTDFREYVLNFSEDMALREARRCLKCGCTGLSKCELRRLATEYEVDLRALDTPRKPLYDVQHDHPFITVDPNKCIYCQRCREVCEYGAMELEASGFDANDLPLDLSIRMNEHCTSCGKCVDHCPTGALVKKNVTFPAPPGEIEKTRTVCPYCGCGCNITLNVNGQTLVEATSDPSHAPGFGNTCVKGRFGLDFVQDSTRLEVPLIRRGSSLVEASWEDALARVSKELLALKDRYGANALAGLSSAKCTNEENFLFQKFMRAAIGTNNVDHCARL